MLATRSLRQAAAHANHRVPSIKFLGPRSIPQSVDHSPQPHPESPTGSLPKAFLSPTRHSSFSSYRDHAQQHGPLQKTIRGSDGPGIGGSSGSDLGPVEAPKGMFFDRSQLPERFRRSRIDLAEMEAVESGGAAVYG